MKQKLLNSIRLRVCMLVAVMCAAFAGQAWADDYELYSGTITEGDYIIYYSGKAMKNTISSNRLTYDEVTPANGIITTTDAAIIWHIAASGNYWTIYNTAVNKYAASTGSNNQAKLETSITNNSKWTVTGTSTYEFENLARSSVNNKWLRNNGTYGFACYASGTGGALSLYKKVVDASKVATPTISVPTGAFVSTKTITIACETDDATIFYTTDGTEPSSSNGDEYDSENKPVISETTTVKAIAVKDDLTDSEVATETFTKETVLDGMSALVAKTNTSDETVYVSLSDAQVTYVTSNNGYMEDASKGAYIFNMSPALNKVYNGIFSIKYQYYNQMPEIKTITAVEGTITDGSTWTPTTLTASALDDAFTANLGRRIKIENYTVTNASKLTENINFYKTYYDPSLAVDSRYTLEGYPYNNNGTKQFRIVSAVKAPEAPEFEFPAGEFSEAFTLNLTCETDGVTIYYTTDGSTPTTSSSAYDEGISIPAATTTVKAIAVKDGIASDVASATYTYKAIAKPAFSPVSGSSVYYGETVSITCATAGTTIYYTTNGDDPTSSSTQYTAPVVIEDAVTLKAIGVKDEDESSVASASYTLKNPDAPTFTVAAGAVERGTVVTISSRNGTEITYTTDGTDPSSGTDAGSNSVNVTIDAAKTLRAICMDGATNISAEGSAAYTIVKVAKPAVSTAAGEVKVGTTITLTCETGGATIYYTLDGSTPTSSSTEYSTPIEIDAAKTIKAIAVKDNCDDSDVLTAAYTIRDYDTATFTFNTAAGRSSMTITKAGASGGGTPIDLSVDDIQITGTSGYVNESSNYLQDYSGATMTVKMKSQDNVISFYIKSITITTVSSYNKFLTGDNISSSGTTWTYTAPNTTTTSVDIENSAQCRVNTIAVNYVIAKKTNANLSYDEDFVKFDDPVIGTIDAEDLPELTITPIAASSAVTYTSSNTSVATVASDGIVTGVGEGTTIITASISDNGTYTDASASYTLQMGLADGGLEYASDAVALTYGGVFSAPALTTNTSATVSYTSSNSNVASVNASTGAVTINSVGSATITASAPKDADYKACEASYTITVSAPSGATSSAATVFYESFDTAEGTGGNDGKWGGSIAQASWASDNEWTKTGSYSGAYQCVKLASGSSNGVITTPSIATTAGTTYKLSFKAGSWEDKSSSLSISASGAGTTLSKNSFTLENATFNNYEATFTASGTSVTLTFTAASGKQVFLDEVRITFKPITSTSVTTTSGYATYCYQYPLDLDGISDAKAYMVSEINTENEKVRLTQITGSIKGGVPFILKSDADTDDIEIPLADESDNVPEGNLLIGTLAPTFVEQVVDGNTNFAYSKKNGCFVKINENGNTVPANRAYLPIDLGGGSVKAFSLSFDTETGINEIGSESGNTIFNLAGQRVNKAQKGLYIMNGKKVLVK